MPTQPHHSEQRYLALLAWLCLLLLASLGCNMPQGFIRDWFRSLARVDPDRVINAFVSSVTEAPSPQDGVQGGPAHLESTALPLTGPAQLKGPSTGPQKPVVFHNYGSTPYTVSPWTYTPLGSSQRGIPSTASTVSIPGGNPSNALLLPLGTYTWCYWWEIGDINNDRMIEYAHALDERPVTLGESASDDIDSATSVGLSAPSDLGTTLGACGMDISQFVVDQQHADNIDGAAINMGHDRDYVTLRGPITVSVWYIHAPVAIGPGTPVEYTVPQVSVIPAGENCTFELVDGRDDHPGDWNMYLFLVSIDG